MRRRFLLVTTLVGVVVSASLGLSSAAATVIFRDFVAGNSLSLWSDAQRAAPDRIRVVPAPGAGGGNALRFEVNHGDKGFKGDAGDRSELAWWDTLVGEGDETRYTWETYLPQDYPTSRRWQDIVQWKNGGTGTPPLQVELLGRCLSLRTGPQKGFRQIWRTPIVRGQWLKFQVRIRWSVRSRIGFVDIEYQGRSVLRGYRMATLYRGIDNYFKIGLYRDNSIRKRGVVYARGITVERLKPSAPRKPWRADKPARC